MPIHRTEGGWQWGNHGHVYPTRAGAEKQAAAAHANGYEGDTQAAGVALKEPSGKLLFLKRGTQGDHPGEWCFPGGHIEAGEGPVEAAIREAREEVGTVLPSAELSPVDLNDGFATFAANVSGEFAPTLNEEHTEFVWAYPEYAPTPLHPGVASTLKMADAADVPQVSERITNATFLYMDPRKPEKKFAQCATCVHFIRDKGLCEWMSADDKVGNGYSCGFYVPGENAVGKEPLNLITPEEAGLVERQVRCENCVFFDPNTEPRKHCDLYTQLNLILPGVFDLDRYVDEYGCCNAQTPGKRNPAVFGPFGPIKHGNEMTGDTGVAKKTRDFAGYYTPEKIGKTRRITPEGFLVLEGTPIARTGEQIYAGHELDGLTPNGAGYITVQRLPEEVFRPETLQSFEGKDFVIEHPPDGVDVTNWKNHTVGHVQNVRRGEGIEDDLIVADIIVKDPMAVDYVNKHLPELSAGYNADYDEVEPGKALQRNIIGNHVAAVKAGRAGARVAVRDHQTDAGVIEMSKVNSSVLRAVLAAVGIKTEDASKVEAAMLAAPTTDAEGESNSELKNISNDMKAIKDWMAARDAEREEEKKQKDAKAAKDAEESAKKEEKKEEAEEHEKTGDTVLEAEGPGMVMNLGKTWKGSMTGDSAATEPVYQAVVARAEILAPGITKPTADSLKGNKGTALASFMRTALEKHVTADGGLANVGPFLMGDSIGNLKGERLIGVFNGAAALARQRNNQRSTTIQSRHTGDFSKPSSIADINERNRKFWAERK